MNAIHSTCTTVLTLVLGLGAPSFAADRIVASHGRRVVSDLIMVRVRAGAALAPASPASTECERQLARMGIQLLRVDPALRSESASAP